MPSQPSKSAKPKKRKLMIDDDDYIQADLNWYKDKQSVQPSPVEQSPTQSTGPTAPPPDSNSTTAPMVPASVQHAPNTSPSITPATDGLPALKRLRSRSPSVPSQHAADVKSQALSVPPPEVASPPKPKELSSDTSDPSSASRSPTLVQLSTQRPRSRERQTETLPSPFANKRAIVKRKGKGKGPPGLKVLPCPPEQLLGLGESTRSGGDARVTASPLSEATSSHTTHVATSQSASVSPAKTSPPPRTTSPPLAPTSPPAGGSDAPAVTAERPLTTTDNRNSPNAPEDSVLVADTTSVSVVLHETTAIVASPEPMDLGSDEPAVPATEADDRIADEATSPIQQDMPDEDVVMRTEPPQPNEVRVDAVVPRPTQEDVVDTAGAEDVEMQLDDMTLLVSPFAHKCIRLLGLTRGHSSYTPAQRPVELAFELTAEEVAQITRWRNRDTITGDLSTSMCLSLVCYPSSQCTAVFAHITDEPSPADVVRCGQPAEWPTDSSVFAVLDSAGGSGPSHSFTLSPPFTQCESDRSVDLGTRGVSPGVNTLRLFQHRDHSDLAFAVVLHHPTAVQLAELQRVREQDRSWHEFLDGLGTFTLPAPTLVPPTLPKVNAVYSRCNM
ncbi:hypothetical protein C8T65DRAFT_53968 [Cerioporus squamosus]|nr:hypothetical protein C8T65DRAFT_53968 [Cerioporus squamosus]